MDLTAEKIKISTKKCVFQEIFLLWLTSQGQYCWQNQNHLMNCAAEMSRFTLSTIHHKTAYLLAP